VTVPNRSASTRTPGTFRRLRDSGFRRLSTLSNGDPVYRPSRCTRLADPRCDLGLGGQGRCAAPRGSADVEPQRNLGPSRPLRAAANRSGEAAQPAGLQKDRSRPNRFTGGRGCDAVTRHEFGSASTAEPVRLPLRRIEFAFEVAPRQGLLSPSARDRQLTGRKGRAPNCTHFPNEEEELRVPASVKSSSQHRSQREELLRRQASKTRRLWDSRQRTGEDGTTAMPLHRGRPLRPTARGSMVEEDSPAQTERPSRRSAAHSQERNSVEKGPARRELGGQSATSGRDGWPKVSRTGR